MSKLKFILFSCFTLLLALPLVACGDAIPDEGAVDETSSEVVMIPIETVFETVAHENDVARTLYTSKVVGGGQKAGIKFDEAWADSDVQAGPLPALFLRLASGSIAQSPVEMGLFLGSDFPISQSNLFSDAQMEKLTEIKESNEPVFFVEGDLQTAMFKDVAGAEPCVVCHNDHPDTPKTDWAMGDIMGATTWTYPKEEVTEEEFYEIITTVRQGFADAYDAFIAELDTFDEVPEIGETWPSEDDYAVPSTDVFMARFAEIASPATLNTVMGASN